MKLKSFISNSIEQVIDGLLEAQAYALKKGVEVRTDASGKQDGFTEVNFNVAVTSEVTKDRGVDAGVNVLSAKASIDTSREKEDSTVNRIAFSVALKLPDQQK